MHNRKIKIFWFLYKQYLYKAFLSFSLFFQYHSTDLKILTLLHNLSPLSFILMANLLANLLANLILNFLNIILMRIYYFLDNKLFKIFSRTNEREIASIFTIVKIHWSLIFFARRCDKRSYGRRIQRQQDTMVFSPTVSCAVEVCAFTFTADLI